MNRNTKPFKYSQLYTGAPKGSEPTLENDWFVYYFYQVPDKKPVKYKRFVIKEGINRIKSVKSRLEYGKELVRLMDRQLDEGFNPFDEISVYMTIGQGIEWAMKQKRLSHETKIAYNSTIKVLEKVLGDKIHHNVLNLTKKQAKDLLLDMIQYRGVGDESFNRYRLVLHAIFAELCEAEIIDNNPFKFKARKLVKETNKYISPEKMKRIREHLTKVKPGLYEFFLIMHMTAIRGTELLRLKCEDVDAKNWCIYLKGGSGKNKRGRTIIIPIKLRAIIKERLIEGHYLFGSNCKPEIRKKPVGYSAYWAMWRKEVYHILGITEKPYWVKHTGIRDMLGEGINPKGVQYQAGHSDQSMTDHYSGGDATIFKDQLENFKGSL